MTMPRHLRSTASNHALSPLLTRASNILPTTLGVLTSKLPRMTTAILAATVAAPSTTAENIGIELGLQIPAILVVKSRVCLTCVKDSMTWICGRRISVLQWLVRWREALPVELQGKVG